MKRIFYTATIIALLASMMPSQLVAQPAKEYLIQSLDVVVEKMLSAYNSEDYVTFYQYFAKKMESATTKQLFDAKYVSAYKPKFGDVFNKKLLLQESLITHQTCELIYEVEFEYCKKGLITVNFTNEYDTYRVVGVRFDRSYEEILNSDHAF